MRTLWKPLLGSCLGVALVACGGPKASLVATATPMPRSFPSASPTVVAGRTSDADENLKPGLSALPGKEKQVPVLTKKTTVTMTTTAGVVVIEVYPEAAPKAAERFLKLARSGFYDQIPVSRVVKGFVAQFGVNWRDHQKKWQDKKFKDDPSLFALERGTVAFAKAAPDSNSTQVFINIRENNRLTAPDLNFAAFAKVVKGMEVVERFAQVGDPNTGLDYGRLWSEGGSYLNSLPDKPTMIESMVVEK